MGYNFKYHYLICHRLPERSFFFKGRQFPVCSRCTGIYIGFFISILFKYLKLFSLPNNFLICFILTFPLLLDGFTQFFKLRESNNRLRLITGLMFGLSYLFI
ncbi:DUF2085 domain-containing protein [Methanobrevibacter sp.]